MKNWILILAIIIFGLLQATLLDFFKIFTVKPDLILIGVVIASLSLRPRWVFVLSVFAGIFKDSLGASSFGVNTLLFPLWSFLIIKLNSQIPLDYDLIRLALVFIVSFLHNACSGLIIISLGNFVPLGIYLRILFLQSLYSSLVLLLIIRITKPFAWIEQE